MDGRKQYRQGDVLLHPIKDLPENLGEEQNTDGSSILAEGEEHGHFHRMNFEAAPLFLSNDGMGMALNVKQATDLTHEEHSAIPVMPGAYDVVIQRTEKPNFTNSKSQINAMRVID